MGIKAVFAAADEIPAAMKDLYIEQDGKFVLDVEGIDDHPKVRGVITANNANKAQRDKLKTQVTDLEAKLATLPEDFNPDEWATLKASGGKGQKGDEVLEALKAQHANQIAALNKKHETEKTELTGKLSERDGYIDRTTVDGSLKDSLLEVGVNTDLLDGAMAALRGQVKVAVDDKGGRRAIVETDLGEVPVAQFVRDWSGSKGKAYLAKPTGPNAPGSGVRVGAKTITRAELNAKSPEEQQKAVLVDKLQVVD